jgi:hypothetical protein
MITLLCVASDQILFVLLTGHAKVQGRSEIRLKNDSTEARLSF